MTAGKLKKPKETIIRRVPPLQKNSHAIYNQSESDNTCSRQARENKHKTVASTGKCNQRRAREKDTNRGERGKNATDGERGETCNGQNGREIDQFQYAKIQPKPADLSTKLWGITT